MAKKKKRNPFAGMNIGRRTSITGLGSETRERAPITLPRISIQHVDIDDDDKPRATNLSSG